MWNKNFLIIIFSQGVSLFANNILYFALSLFVLDKTGSATIFGMITAISVIPTILFMPIGGVIADRINKRKVLVCSNFLISIFVMIFSNLLNTHYMIFGVVILLLILSIIEILYTPCVNAAIPLIQQEKYLIKSNAVSNQIAFFSNIIGPVIGGILYGFFGINSIIFCSIFFFILSAFVNLLICIPEIILPKHEGNYLTVMIDDLKEAFMFLKTNKSVFKIILASTVINFTIVPFVTLGLPYFINIKYDLTSEFYGFASACLTISALLGGTLTVTIGDKIKSNHLYYMLIFMSVILFPSAIAMYLELSSTIYIFVICLMAEQFVSNIFTICENSYFQIITPNHLIGKIMSFIVTIAICGDPISRIIYGPLLDLFYGKEYILVLISTLVAMILTMCSKKSFKLLDKIVNEGGNNYE